uniref:Neurotransmitter-gated ion-channel ligand-binding domain-containing protein n=1 Tax=Parascaris univalens TaxID=6257 RepID=A0A915AHI6_PARUN
MWQLSISLIAGLLIIGVESWTTETNKKLEDTLMKSYNRKHRPVKKESTTMQIQVYLLISHVEKVDEYEQTMMLHGLLWATWIDEYLQWEPSKYNNTRRIAIDSWKIWQPALSLYNSARGNSWYLHMGGLPASVGSDGKVWASGSFSFYVTCMFDFTNYPYDEQECPIVVADWVYDLSKVNLSDPSGNAPWNKPAVKLSYDPLNNNEAKKHVAGWEVRDTWRRQCYWGPNGCKDESPDGQPEWFWSLIEFGIRIKRHAPYFGLTVILPSLVTSLLTLAVFWIDTSSLAIAMLTFNILLEGLFGWDLLKKLPPGSGGTPKIVSLYGFNLSLTAIAFILHVVINYLENVLPDNLEFPFQMTNITERLRQMSPFSIKGLSFDPQKLLTGDAEEDNLPIVNPDLNPPTIITSESEERSRRTESTENKPIDNSEIPLEDTRQKSQMTETKQENELGHVAQQLYTLRRLMFFLYLIMYVITLPICLL